jgi:GNAT superfamily N-acetyltransferase
MEPAAPPFSIRPPTEAERRACRMLLPRASSSGQRCRFFVAVVGEPARVVGAAAIGMDRRVETRGAWQVDLRVIVPYRRRGIGRALVERVVGQARRHGVGALHAWDWVEPAGDTARAWAALGFAPAQRKLEYETNLAFSLPTILPLYEQVRERGWIPDAARIVALSDADRDAVAALHEQFLGGSRRLLMPLLDGSAPGAYDPAFSRVLLLDGRVVGFTLGRILPGGVCEIDANVLHPSVRLGWANLWLKVEAAQLLMSHGVHTIRYFSLEQHTDTHRLSRQAGAKLIRTLVQMRRELSSSPAADPSAAGA